MKAFAKQLEEGLVVIRELKALPTIKELISSSTSEQIEKVYLAKVRSCCVLFDFSNDNNTHMEEKDIKRKTLLELINFMELP